MTPRRPIVDLSGKPSRWRRLIAWCWSLIDPPAPYRAQPCDNELARVIYTALIAITIVALIAAWVFWPRSL